MRGRWRMFWRTESGQATVEAACTVPLLFVLMLMVAQPGIVLYDRMVMRQAAAEGCRLLVTSGASPNTDGSRCIDAVKRQLAAVPPHDLFHVHNPACSWDVQVQGNERSERVSVSIRNRVRLLPLFDFTGVLVGIADDQGCIEIEVSASAPVQPDWVVQSQSGSDPGSWVRSKRGGN